MRLINLSKQNIMANSPKAVLKKGGNIHVLAGNEIIWKASSGFDANYERIIGQSLLFVEGLCLSIGETRGAYQWLKGALLLHQL